MKEWMEPKLSKPTEVTLVRVKALLSAGITRQSIASCCSACKNALKWLERRRIKESK
jgi:hypothetical protein